MSARDQQARPEIRVAEPNADIEAELHAAYFKTLAAVNFLYHLGYAATADEGVEGLAVLARRAGL